MFTISVSTLIIGARSPARYLGRRYTETVGNTVVAAAAATAATAAVYERMELPELNSAGIRRELSI